MFLALHSQRFYCILVCSALESAVLSGVSPPVKMSMYGEFVFGNVGDFIGFILIMERVFDHHGSHERGSN